MRICVPRKNRSGDTDVFPFAIASTVPQEAFYYNKFSSCSLRLFETRVLLIFYFNLPSAGRLACW